MNNLCGGNRSLAHNKLYRNFIILQEDEKSHAASGEKALSGYAKIEAKSDKCKISFYAQNLKRDENYSIVLICYKKDLKQIVDLGSLMVSEVGKGESSKEYYVNNIAGLDFSYDKISGASICRRIGGELIFSMYGFMNGENINDNWKKCKVIKHEEKKEELKEEIAIKEKKEIKYMEIKKEHNEEVKNKKEEIEPCDFTSIEEECNYKHEEEKPEHKKMEEKCDHKHEHKKMEEKCDNKHEEDMHEHEKDGCCKDNMNMGGMGSCKKRDEIEAQFDEYEARIERNRGVDPYDFELRGAIGEYFSGIVNGFEECGNQFKDLKYCKWYRVKVNSLDDMCNISNYNRYTIAYYPMLNYYPYIKKYGHFMMGYKCDSNGDLKYIVYGVPGKKDRDEQPYAGKTGFVTWVSTDKEDLESKTRETKAPTVASVSTDKEDLGCWLMFYDYKSSTVVVPMK